MEQHRIYSYTITKDETHGNSWEYRNSSGCTQGLIMTKIYDYVISQVFLIPQDGGGADQTSSQNKSWIWKHTNYLNDNLRSAIKGLRFDLSYAYHGEIIWKSLFWTTIYGKNSYGNLSATVSFFSFPNWNLTSKPPLLRSSQYSPSPLHSFWSALPNAMLPRG